MNEPMKIAGQIAIALISLLTLSLSSSLFLSHLQLLVPSVCMCILLSQAEKQGCRREVASCFRLPWLMFTNKRRSAHGQRSLAVDLSDNRSSWMLATPRCPMRGRLLTVVTPTPVYTTCVRFFSPSTPYLEVKGPAGIQSSHSLLSSECVLQSIALSYCDPYHESLLILPQRAPVIDTTPVTRQVAQPPTYLHLNLTACRT